MYVVRVTSARNLIKRRMTTLIFPYCSLRSYPCKGGRVVPEQAGLIWRPILNRQQMEKALLALTLWILSLLKIIMSMMWRYLHRWTHPQADEHNTHSLLILVSTTLFQYKLFDNIWEESSFPNFFLIHHSWHPLSICRWSFLFFS